MAIKSYKDVVVKIDNAAGSLTEITCALTSESIASTWTALDKSAICDDNTQLLLGRIATNLSWAGFVNSTSEAIFGPLMEVSTSVTKTFSVYNGQQYYTGEAWVTDYSESGNNNDLVTWSATLNVTGAVNRTSAAPT